MKATKAALSALGIEQPRRKYRNTPVEVDGVKFDSKREAARYGELKLLERAGVIGRLSHHQRIGCWVKGVKVCDYEADFVYTDLTTGELVVEDVKSPATRRNPVYRLKAKLLKAAHGIVIREV